jgi:cyanophycin synthetase
MNVLSLRGGTVIFDYGHNASALRAITAALDVFPHRRRSVVYSMAGDRRDADIVHIGELLGDAFDSVIVYDAYTVRGRPAGEIPALIRQGLEGGSRVREIIIIPDPVAAMKAALDKVGPGDLLVLQYDSMDEAVDVVKTYLSCDLEPGHESGALALATEAR